MIPYIPIASCGDFRGDFSVIFLTLKEDYYPFDINKNFLLGKPCILG